MQTDQSSLKNLMEQTELLAQYQRWVTKLLGYDFVIEYKAGRFNKVADALSRQGPMVELKHLSTPYILDVEVIQEEVNNDDRLQQIKKDIEEDSLTHPKHSVQQGRLLYKGRLVLSSTSQLIPTYIPRLRARRAFRIS